MMANPTAQVHKLEDVEDSVEPSAKRLKLEQPSENAPVEHSSPSDGVLPPSHSLLGVGPAPQGSADSPLRLRECDVGISEYIGKHIPPIQGIIKQRFTDFLVYEVNQDSEVQHLKFITKPSSSKVPSEGASQEAGANTKTLEEAETATNTDAKGNSDAKEEASAQPELQPTSTAEPWPVHFDTTLEPYFLPESIAQLKKMFLEGPEPPRVSDEGWGGRAAKLDTDAVASSSSDAPAGEETTRHSTSHGRTRNDRGRGGRGRGRGGRSGNAREDTRRVFSKPTSVKDVRTEIHKLIRLLFAGKIESETDSSVTEEGSRIVLKWGRGGGGARGARGGGNSRGTYPPYIHFTLQKTNRDTQDALAYLSRMLHVNVRDLAVAGTKDKRAVTTQRVSLKRGNKTVEETWQLANGLKGSKRPESDALTKRGERGIRIGDFNYRKAALELGMLKGNAFLITLRNIQVDSTETLHAAMAVMKEKGFINYYGMQRFGTADIPTHSIGLAILRSDWHKAVDLILQKRHGEHPDVAAAREAWLVNGDIDRALELMPRRVIAERCILESYKKQKGETRNAMGALSTIPKNLRLMYIHAYQSYVWNAIVSERVRTFGLEKPVPGDLVFENGNAPAETNDEEEMDTEAKDTDKQDMSSKAKKKAGIAWVAPKVKVLTAEDVASYSIFDVIVPLPGRDVAYPGGELGEKYRQFLVLDGLDPDNFERKQKEYVLGGSYRTLLHQPKELSYSILRYTDPDVALAQADEDKILGFDPPVIAEDARFTALQIKLTLGTAAYATMALREVTKTETSSHHQTQLTKESDDQQYRGTESTAVDNEEAAAPQAESGAAEAQEMVVD